jgi:uncharacterized glyoxalase superfamily protein PhnB
MAAKPVPEGYRTATPYLIVKDAAKLLDFVKSAFSAKVKEEHRMPDGRVMHADVMIGDSHVMMGQAGERWPESTGSILLYVPNADRSYEAAVKAGAELREESKVLILGAAITRNELRKRHGMEELPGAKGEELVEAKGEELVEAKGGESAKRNP